MQAALTRGLTSVIVASLVALGSPPVLEAQESVREPHAEEAPAEQGSVAKTGDPTLTEEIVVSAQKREQPLREVPISIQAFTDTEVDTLGVTTVSDLNQAAPSLDVGGIIGSSQQQLGLRGIVDFSRNPGIDARMGVYVDGVYQGRSYTSDQPLYGIERVEILRGPQGTLFGKNTVSGAINLITKKATERTELQFRGEVGNFESFRGSLFVAGALSDRVLGSLAVSADLTEGYYRNITLDTDTGSRDRNAVRGKLRFLPDDRIEVVATADWFDSTNHSPLSTNRSLPPFETQQGIESSDEVEAWGTALTVNYTLESGAVLSAITGYRDAKSGLLVDDDLTPVNIQISGLDEKSRQVTQELRYVVPRHDRYDWVGGVYYYDAENSTGRSSCFGADLFHLLIPSLAQYANALSGCVSAPSTVDVRALAGYVHGNYRFTEALELTAGLRYTYEDKSVEWVQVNAPNDPVAAAQLEAATGIPLTQSPGVFFGAVNSSLVDQRSEDDWSPTLGLNYFIGDTMLYGRYSRAHKSGGYNTEFMTNGLENFEYGSESVDAYEAGLKTVTLGGRLRTNATLFVSRFRDFQVFQFLVNSAGATSLELTNAGRATSQGVELETIWIPVRPFQLRLNVTALDARYNEFENPDPDEPDFDGNKLPYAPDWKTFLGMQYIHTLASGGYLTFNIDYSYVGEQFSDPSNADPFRIDSYGLVDARVRWMPPGGGWELALWSRNLADERYARVNNLNFLGTPRTIWGEPRTYGFTVAYQFAR